ncbi:MAG: DNA repair protein RecO [Bacilli bacterium]|nr:DNA repair protein RecO [Bacilli bacterium]MBN2877931.1 DNA repair protein RecO [Bacilli bacterium]
MEYIEGLILKKLDYKESSQILYLYTDKGLMSVLVHGSRKVKSPYLNLTRVLNLVGLHTSGKDLQTLRDGDVLEDFRDLKENIETFTYLQHILELVYHIAQHEHDHEKLYLFLLKILAKVKTTEAYIPYLNMVELKLLHLLGINPLFTSCTSCGKTDHLQFSVREGGMCCKEHYQGNEPRVSDECVKLMMKLYYYDLQAPTPIDYTEETLRELRGVIDRYYEYHLNFRSNSRKMLVGLIGY